jgi:hypothetical protein
MANWQAFLLGIMTTLIPSMLLLGLMLLRLPRAEQIAAAPYEKCDSYGHRRRATN